MRRIILYQSDSSKIELLDNSGQDLDEYCKELSRLFQISNIAILKTSEGHTFIGRPSKLTGIVVEEVCDKSIENISPQQEEKQKEVEVDIITDVD